MSPYLILVAWFGFLVLVGRVCWVRVPPVLSEDAVRACGAPLSHAVEVTDR